MICLLALIPSSFETPDGETIINAAAGAVDIKLDVFLGVFVGQVQQLRHHEVSGVLIDVLAQEDDTLVKQAAVDVERPLTLTRLFDDGRDKIVRRFDNTTHNILSIAQN